MFSVPNGKPGVLTSYTATPGKCFWPIGSSRNSWQRRSPLTARFSSNPSNAPYTWLLFAGTLLGRVTSTGKYANSILGLTTVAYAHSGGGSTTITTDVNTAAELARRVGATGTFKLTGPPTAAGTVATQTITYSAINTGTGAITVTAGSADAVIGSLIQPTDGSETIVTMICDAWGKKVSDQLNSTRVDVYDAQLLAAGGTINVASIVNYPTDTSLQAWVKTALKAKCPAVNFSDDFA